MFIKVLENGFYFITEPNEKRRHLIGRPHLQQSCIHTAAVYSRNKQESVPPQGSPVINNDKFTTLLLI